MSQNQELDKVPSKEDHVENHVSGATEAQENGLEFDHEPSKIKRFYAHPWTQILLISFICFCLPGVCYLATSITEEP